MGGINSTRWNGHRRRLTVEDGVALSLHQFARGRTLTAGVVSQGTVSWPDGFTVAFSLDTSDHMHPVLSLAFGVFIEGARHIIRQTLHLVSIPNQLGGERWFMLCPLSGRRCEKVYLPTGADQFASRQAYHLAYRTQRERAHDRMATKAAKLRARVVDRENSRRKWLHLSTYENAMYEADELEEQAMAMLIGSAPALRGLKA